MGYFDKKPLAHAFAAQEDKIVLAKVLSAAENSIEKHKTVFTDFIDPVKLGFLTEFISKNSDIKIKSYGGAYRPERAVMGFCPDYMDYEKELDDENFPVVRIKISYGKNYSKNISHRDLLGAITALSIDRGKIGDLILQDGYSYAIVKKEIEKFIIQSLLSVGKAIVSCERADFMEINSDLGTSKEKTATVASLRLDGVLAHCFNISRADAANAVKSEKVFVNWASVSNGAKPISEGDIITLRGKGRLKILNMSGRTKKDRYVVEYLLY